MQPNPGHGVLAADVVGVIRLVLMPHEGQGDYAHHASLLENRTTCRARFREQPPIVAASSFLAIVPSPWLCGKRLPLRSLISDSYRECGRATDLSISRRRCDANPLPKDRPGSAGRSPPDVGRPPKDTRRRLRVRRPNRDRSGGQKTRRRWERRHPTPWTTRGTSRRNRSSATFTRRSQPFCELRLLIRVTRVTSERSGNVVGSPGVLRNTGTRGVRPAQQFPLRRSVS